MKHSGIRQGKDPLTYQFSFDALTTNAHEPFISAMYRSLLEPCQEWAIRWVNPNGHTAGQTNADDSSNVGRLQFSGVAGSITPDLPGMLLHGGMSKDAIKQAWRQMLTRLDETDAYESQLYSNQKHALSCARSPYADRYRRFFSANFDCSLCAQHADEIASLLNCPDEAQYPVAMQMSPFRTAFFLTSLMRYDLSVYPVQVMANLPDAWRGQKVYMYNISIRIPRCFVQADHAQYDLQNQWVRAMLALGEQYAISRGSLTVDLPTSYLYNPFSCYDAQISFIERKKHFDSMVPGYAWGMLLNKDMAGTLPFNSEAFGAVAFHQVQHMANGNVFTQMTERMECVTAEQNIRLRDFVISGNCLPNLKIPMGEPPPSLRIACTEKDLLFDDLDYMTLFNITSNSAPCGTVHNPACADLLPGIPIAHGRYMALDEASGFVYTTAGGLAKRHTLRDDKTLETFGRIYHAKPHVSNDGKHILLYGGHSELDVYAADDLSAPIIHQTVCFGAMGHCGFVDHTTIVVASLNVLYVLRTDAPDGIRVIYGDEPPADADFDRWLEKHGMIISLTFDDHEIIFLHRKGSKTNLIRMSKRDYSIIKVLLIPKSLQWYDQFIYDGKGGFCFFCAMPGSPMLHYESFPADFEHPNRVVDLPCLSQACFTQNGRYLTTCSSSTDAERHHTCLLIKTEDWSVVQTVSSMFVYSLAFSNKDHYWLIGGNQGCAVPIE